MLVLSTRLSLLRFFGWFEWKNEDKSTGKGKQDPSKIVVEFGV